ncbi:MAG TPA: nucleoside-diphosphate kinase [Candidatus Dormibacteraeota bacterium]|nr:nucleoside-diphosphate kinase [Candidatus Dormibacteraeota bacterium]
MADALVIFKPDSAYRLAAREGLWGWLSSERDWKIESLEWFPPPASLIEGHYDFLQGRPFFPWLVDFMSALPVVVGRISAEPQALGVMRYDLGETQIAKSRPGSLRERYGIYGGLNCLHLSDAPETGAAEVKRWSDHVQLDRVNVDDLTRTSDKPDHTFHLRSLATQVAGGNHAGSASAMIRQLLAEETELGGDEFDALCRITLGALTA